MLPVRLEARQPPGAARRHLCAEAHQLDAAVLLHGVVETDVFKLGLLPLEHLLLARSAQRAVVELRSEARVDAPVARLSAAMLAVGDLSRAQLAQQRVEARIGRRSRCGGSRYFDMMARTGGMVRGGAASMDGARPRGTAFFLPGIGIWGATGPAASRKELRNGGHFGSGGPHPRLCKYCHGTVREEAATEIPKSGKTSRFS